MTVDRRRGLKIKRQLLIDFLGGKCVQCNSKEDLDFDHIDPKTRSFFICDYGNLYKSLKILIPEVKKCQLLCHSCHGKKTGNERYPNPQTKQHGTYSCYTYSKCRCDLCRQAAKNYRAGFSLKTGGKS